MPQVFLELPASCRQEAFNFAASQTGDAGAKFQAEMRVLRAAFATVR
jgi:hypothetical protein